MIPICEILNEEQTSETIDFKIEKSLDKQAIIKINVSIKYLGNTEVAKNQINIERSYFPEHYQP